MNFFSKIAVALMPLLMVACGGSYTLGGTVTGLSGGELVLTISGESQFGEDTEVLTITENTEFITTKDFIADTEFSVAITKKPDAISCSATPLSGLQ